MKSTMRTLILASVLVCTGLVQAQDKAPSTEQLAKNRVDCYVKALGLTDEESQALFKHMLMGEEAVADLRAKLAEVQAEVDAGLAKNDEMAEANLTEEQRAKLETMRKEGWKPCSEPCEATGAKAACAGKAAAKGACCAGGGKAEGSKAAAPTPRPNATIK